MRASTAAAEPRSLARHEIGLLPLPAVSHLSFGATLVAVPLWFGVLMSTASEVNEAGVVAYGVMLLFLAPACAYVTSRRLGPSALRASWPWRSPWAGVAWVTISSATIAGAWFAYYPRLNQGGGTFGVLLWYLTAMLGPPIVAGCLVHLLADRSARRRSAG